MPHDPTLSADNVSGYYDTILLTDNFSPCVRCHDCRLKSHQFSFIIMNVARDVITYILWIVYLFLMSVLLVSQRYLVGRCGMACEMAVCACSGSYDIYVGGKRLGSYNDSGSFGELALMYNQPRAATILAASPGSLWAMVSATFLFGESWGLLGGRAPTSVQGPVVGFAYRTDDKITVNHSCIK